MKKLFMAQPIKIHTKTAPNRIVYHPMECCDADERGNPTDLTLERYRKFAEGRPGVIFVEGCKVTKESSSAPGTSWGNWMATQSFPA